MQRASRLQPRQIEWLLKPQIGERIPFGMISMVGSRPGQGKSSLANYLTAQATRQAMSVIHSNQEDALREVLVPRLMAAGADMKKVFIPEDPIVLPEDLGKLEKLIKQTRSRLFIADTAAQHLSVSLSSDQEVRRALTPLRKLLEREQCACLFIVHTKMGHFNHPLDAFFGGSAGLKGAARVIYLFGPDPRNPSSRVLMPVKSNIGPIDQGTEFVSDMIAFETLENGRPKQHKVITLRPIHAQATVSPKAMLKFSGSLKGGRDEDDGGLPTRLAMAEEWLTGMLRKGPMKVKDLDAARAEIKLSAQTMRRASSALSIEKKFGGPKNGWTWDLPVGHPLRKKRKGDAKKSVDAELSEVLGGAA